MPEMDTYVALDLEMTGIDPKKDRIIEIGAVLVEQGEIKNTFSSLVNPRCTLSDRIIEITGITQAEVDAAPRLEEMLTPLSEFLGNRVLLGHRILSDYAFLKRAYVNVGAVFEKKGIDTLKLARKYLAELPSKRLPQLCAYYGISQHAHRALEDAIAAHLLYQRLRTDFYKEETKKDFEPAGLVYKVKKEAPASKKQKERLLMLIEKHTLSMTVELDSMSKNEVSRMTDKILAKYGR